jgi:4-hydroxybenzoate polyprenyltransferase
LATIAFTLLYYLNPFTRYLAVAGILVAALYPLMKRWTYLPQVVLGVAFSWGILMAFAQVNGKLESATGLYFTASLLWIVAYDTWYAMVDREDDIKAGIKSTAILFGEADRFIISILMASCLFALILLGQMKTFGVLYYLGLVVVAGLFIRQLMTTRSKDTAAYFAAFKNNIWVGFVIFVSVVMETLAGPSLQNLAKEFLQ